jgi:hypothetical protein
MIPLDAEQVKQIEEIILGMYDPEQDVSYRIEEKLE